jgi:hypothetical protein
MSARLNMEPIRYFPWKGKTFSQITTSIQKNKPIYSGSSIRNYFNAPPLKMYRREIVTSGTYASNSVTHCNVRTSVRIDEMNMPSGYIVPTTTAKGEGLVNTLDIHYTNSMYDRNVPSCNNSTTCINHEKNALRRVRSSGMIKKKINTNDTYSVSSSQYLHSRNKTYNQNIFTVPHATEAIVNVNSQVPAKKYCVVYKPNNKQFAQQGAVTASSLTARVKYDSITNAGSAMKTAYGNAMANSVAYGVPFVGGRNIKTKIGYSQRCIPIIKKDGSIDKCQMRNIQRI